METSPGSDGKLDVLFCGQEFPGASEALRQALPGYAELRVCPASAVETEIARADVVVPAMVAIDDGHLQSARRLRLIQQFATGVERIDTDSAARRGIPVCNIPAGETGNAGAVAEMALLHLVALLRGYREATANARTGVLGMPVGRGVAGKRVVVLGLGAVGQQVVRRLLSYEATVVCVSRRSIESGVATVTSLGAHEYFELGELVVALSGADALIVCLRATPENAGLVAAAELAAMNDRAVVVNVARGALLDYDAVREAVEQGRLTGVGLDVYWTEPPDTDDPIFSWEASLTPHIGAVTEEVYARMAAVAVENIERLVQGQPLLHQVSG